MRRGQQVGRTREAVRRKGSVNSYGAPQAGALRELRAIKMAK